MLILVDSMLNSTQRAYKTLVKESTFFPSICFSR